LQRTKIKTKKTIRKVVLKGKKVQPPKKTKDIPVTAEHLEAVESKLSKQITTVFLKTVTNNEDIRHLNKRMDSLKSEISSKFAKVDIRFNGTDEKFLGLEQRLDRVEIRLDKLEVRMDSLERRMDRLEERMDGLGQRMDRLEFEIKKGFSEIKEMILGLTPQVHRQTALYEEQNSCNRFVLDGYAQLYEEQKKINARLERLETAAKF
jgi:chromosome segregation ATPase